MNEKMTSDDIITEPKRHNAPSIESEKEAYQRGFKEGSIHATMIAIDHYKKDHPIIDVFIDLTELIKKHTGK